LALRSEQPGGQGCTGAKEHAGESQEVTEQLADATKTIPKVPQEVEGGTHATMMAKGADDGNLP
jgi:hypothetical protein